MKAEKVLTTDEKGNLRFHIPNPPKELKTEESSSTSLNRYRLNFPATIIIVHDDLDPWAEMGVGLDEKRQLVIEMSYERAERDFRDTRFSLGKRIVISQKGTERLIRQLKTSLTKLPTAFADEFAYYEEGEESWDVQEVFDIYNEILNYLECLNIRYRTEKEYN